MYTIYFPGLGEITIPKRSMHKCGQKACFLGHDSHKIPVGIIVDKLCMPTNQFDDCDYCHITSYTRFGIKTKCNIYLAIR